MTPNAEYVGHPWRPTMVNGHPLMVCRVCGRWYDDDIHGPLICHNCGSDRTVWDPADGYCCLACGASDADE